MASNHSPAAALTALLGSPQVAMQRVAELLDGLAPDARAQAVASLGGREQGALWKAAEGWSEIALGHVIPEGTPALQQVRHFGRNTLPAFTVFEKRFYRTRDGVVCGANFQTFAFVTGPGYFTVSAVPERRELLIDCTQVPSEAPAGWPPIVSNDRGLPRLAYGGLRDRLRRVSEHVSIGAPERNGKPLGSWFVLCRQAP